MRRELLSELGIGPNAILYGAFCPSESTAILSPIPPECWDKAYKIIVHCERAPGSLAAVAKAIADRGIGVVASWASNESAGSHLSCTFVVVMDADLLKKLGGEEGLCRLLREKLNRHLSNLPQFGPKKGSLAPIRVTPLAFLSAYRHQLPNADWHQVHVEGHSLNLGRTAGLQGKRAKTSLWQRLLNACQCESVTACILSCDTEEALLRVAPIPPGARLWQIEFGLEITSDLSEFPGYWQAALDALAVHDCSVFVAQNLLVSKTVMPPSEEAEFRFTVDARESVDAGRSLQELRREWQSRFDSCFRKVARKRGDEFKLHEVRITRPRGIGVPCFLATNAKRGEIEARVAVAICRLLEGHGFKPVSVEIAVNRTGLRDEVCNLVKACHFMVVLHCPENKLQKQDGKFGTSQWVSFEEGLMQAQGGHIMTLLCEDVAPPDYCDRVWVQLPHLAPNATTLDTNTLDEISARLAKWEPAMTRVEGSAIPDDAVEWDLVAYYTHEPRKTAR